MMTRFLLAATALTLAPGLAAAAEWKAGVRGYMNVGVSAADIDNDDDGFGVFRDGEIHFRAKLEADNGLTFAARVELEAFTTGDQIDENWASVSGAFGTILIGGADTALNEHGGVGVLKPTGSYLNYYDDDSSFLPGDPGGFIGEDDAIGIRYFFEFDGFEAGVSYQPDEGADGGSDTGGAPVFEPDGAAGQDQFAFGASYGGDFGGFEVEVGGGFLTNDTEDQYHFGAEFGFSGFAVAGFYNREDPDGASPDDLERFGVGALYKTGPITFGGGYVHTNGMNGGGDEDFVHVGGTYQLAPGVAARAAVQYGQEDIGDVEGVAGFAWLSLNF